MKTVDYPVVGKYYRNKNSNLASAFWGEYIGNDCLLTPGHDSPWKLVPEWLRSYEEIPGYGSPLWKAINDK